jgi:hypothetical protein
MPTADAPATTRASCEGCYSPRVTELWMTLTDGSPVHFVSCHACEQRSWRQNGETLGFDSVLAKARKIK